MLEKHLKNKIINFIYPVKLKKHAEEQHFY